MEEVTSRELEWYDLETRMRKLLHEHLEPVLQRNLVDREAHAALRAAHEELTDKVTQLDVLVCGDSSTALSRVYAKIAEKESDRKADQAAVDQTMALMQEKLGSFQFQLNSGREASAKIERMNELLTRDLLDVKHLIQKHQDVVVEEMQKLSSGFSQMNATYTEFAIKTEETAQRALVYADSNAMSLSYFKQEVDRCSASIEEFRSSLRELHTNKLSLTQFFEAEAVLQSHIDALKLEDIRLQQEIAERDSFLDKYFPLRVATMVSNALHASLEPAASRRAAEYEHTALTLLNERTLEDTIDSRPTAVNKIIMAMKEVETRKVQLLSDEENQAQGENTVQEENKTQEETIELHSQERALRQEGPRELKTIDISSELAAFANTQIFPELAAFRTLFKQELISQATHTQKLCEENLLYAQEVLTTVEEYQRKQTKERADSLLLVAENKQKLTEHANQLAAFNDRVSHMTLMLVCLVENIQVQHALSLQEEERPESTPKSPALHSHSVSIHHSFLAQPATPRFKSGHSIYYRNQKFSRSELLNVMCKALETSWVKASKHLSWNKHEFEQILLDAANGVITEEALPVLSSRRRRSSMGSRKHRMKTRT